MAGQSLLAKGVDPSSHRKLERASARLARSNTFRLVAEELMEKFQAEGDDPKTLKKSVAA